MESDYTPLINTSSVEEYVKNNPTFKRNVRYEPSTQWEGSILLTDGSHLFGYVSEDDFQALLEGRIQVAELTTQPAILDYIDCDTIELNTKRLMPKESTSDIAPPSDTPAPAPQKTSSFIPDRKSAAIAVILVIVTAVAALTLPSLLFSESKGYSEEFYSSGMAQKKLANLEEKWVQFQETEATKSAKLAKHTAMDIKQFYEEVDKERLTAEQKEVLGKLYEKAKTHY